MSPGFQQPSKVLGRTPPLFTFKHAPDYRRLPSNPNEPNKQLLIKTIVDLGNVSSTSTSVKRDLGFYGRLGDYAIITYGDTMFTSADKDDTFRGMTCNSVAIATINPTWVLDPKLEQNDYPQCFLMPSGEYQENPSVFSLGITNVIEVFPGEGILYFLLNHRPDFKNHLLGAGVAKVTLKSSGGHPVPVAEMLSKFWWNGETEPWYGDVCALRAGNHIYAYGHAKDNPWVYLARVDSDSATDLGSYEYWNGDEWQKERLYRPELSGKQSIFWQINQGQIYWSKYHGCFVFIYCDNFWSCQILAKTASAPEGPWSEPTTLYKPKPLQALGNAYAPIPHPYYDPSGETLVITFTNHPNTIQAIKVEFTKD